MKKLTVSGLILVFALSCFAWNPFSGLFSGKDKDVKEPEQLVFGTTRSIISAEEVLSGNIEIYNNRVLINQGKRIPENRVAVIGVLGEILKSLDGDYVKLTGKYEENTKQYFIPKKIEFFTPGQYTGNMEFTSGFVFRNKDIFYVYKGNNQINLAGYGLNKLDLLFPDDMNDEIIIEREKAGITTDKSFMISRTNMKFGGFLHITETGVTVMDVKVIEVPEIEYFRFYRNILNYSGTVKMEMSDSCKIVVNNLK